MKNRKLAISTIRKISQIFFFLLLVYGGFLYLKHVNINFLPFVQPNPEIKKINSLDAPQAYTEVIETYTPFRTCRYLGGNRIFRACSLHYLTEVPAYGVPLYDFLPHFLIIILLSFIFARLFCGWICPLGSISDFLSYTRKTLRLEKFTPPTKFYDFLKKARLIWLTLLFILAIAIVVPFIGINAFKNELFLTACQTCPARNIFPLISGIKPTGFEFNNPITIIISLIGILFLISIALAFFGKRIWCRFCPNGIILSWFNKGSLVTKEKDFKKCSKCGICKRVCPMDNDHVYKEKKNKIISSKDCINCFTCIDKCPEDNCLKAKFAGVTLFKSKYKS